MKLLLSVLYKKSPGVIPGLTLTWFSGKCALLLQPYQLAACHVKQLLGWVSTDSFWSSRYYVIDKSEPYLYIENHFQ